MFQEILNIKGLDLNMIAPSREKMYNDFERGSKLVVLGKPGTGKTALVSNLLNYKKDIFSFGMVMNDREDSNEIYDKMFPETFVYNKLEEDKIEDFINRQKLAKKQLQNPWALLLLDDCTDDSKFLKSPLFQGIFRSARHWKMMFILSLQNCESLDPGIRLNTDGIFILKETDLSNRKSIWINYAGIIPDFSLFCKIMDQITDDYTALYIDNTTKSNKLEDCIFWFKARISLCKIKQD